MHRLILALILVAGFALRVWNNDYGLPFVYSIDEASHFTSRAVEMFWQDLDPGYYQNPSAYTYLIYGLLRVLYGPLGFVFDLPFGNVTEQFDKDPAQIWIAARTLAAALCIAGVAATYAAARRLAVRAHSAEPSACRKSNRAHSAEPSACRKSNRAHSAEPSACGLGGTREGLVAAAVLAFAFLPVAYSRVAVTDVGALAGMALALLWSVRVYERGRLRDYALAGAAGGLALAFKYTAGLALAPLAVAALARLRADRARPLGGLALAGVLAAAVFAALNPYLFGSLGEWWADLRDQADVAANDPKPGQGSGGVSYYLDSLTWGLGWAGLVAAVAGAALVLRRDPVRGLMLVVVPLTLFAYLSVQSRYFGRWLLPAYPALAMLAAVAVVRAAELVSSRARARTPAKAPSVERGRTGVRAPTAAPGAVSAPGERAAGGGTEPTPRSSALQAAAVTALTLIVLAQPLAADVRTALVLGREDTLSQARAWLEQRFPPELRVSIEPAVPGRYFRSNPDGATPDWLTRCPRRDGWTEPGWSFVSEAGRRVCAQYKPGLFVRPDGGVRASAYQAVLEPEVIDDYRLYGYCMVMTVNVVRERAERDPEARAYYARLDRESKLLRRFSPYDEGAEPVPFSFDLSYNYYPPEYERPGPTVSIYRLDDCAQAYGPPLIRVPKAREPAPF